MLHRWADATEMTLIGKIIVHQTSSMQEFDVLVCIIISVHDFYEILIFEILEVFSRSIL